MERLIDRRDAGRRLAGRLEKYAGRDDTIVLGMPRGGVVVAFEVARALGVPLDVFIVRKLGVPWQKELAMGAISSGGVRVLNDEVVGSLGLTEDQIEAIAAREQAVLEEREREYRGHSTPLELSGKTVILVDDGLATGASMRAAIQSLKNHRPARIVVAVPTGESGTCAELGREVDEIICLMTPRPFVAVGLAYEDFSQTSDEEVIDLLERARSLTSAGSPTAGKGGPH